MKIIISPAKKMVVDQDSFLPTGQPIFLERTEKILHKMQQLSYSEAQKLWKTSDKLTQTNYEQLQNIKLDRQLTPAVLSYSGIQYQYMAPDILTKPALDHLQDTLRILSGFYGILKPFDGIVPYRLEIGSRLKVAGKNNLYAFWGEKLYSTLKDDGPIINLASKEYSKAIVPYLQSTDQFVDVVFAHLVDGKLRTRATPAKMARGEMVRFVAENHLTGVEELKEFESPTYSFDEKRSTTNKLVFVH
ncbi:MAG TPA: peroxide stress protein YaaA [Candidatus Ligilactobacillus excrementavium]|nr:peroxide stress protein YaaA [Candidatus Ligilactobacillus excrementavium]